jgi:phage FluMu protein Com
LLRDQFIAGLRSTKLIRVLITTCEEETFEQTVKRAKQHEQIAADVEDINSEQPGGRVYLNKQQSRPRYNKENYSHQYRKDNMPQQIHGNYVCIRCTGKGKHLAKDCFALKMKCNKCKKMGHIAKACRSKTYTGNRTNYIDENGYITPAEERDHEDFVSVKQL